MTPWNYPLMMAIWKFAPALAAGNTVVLKPSDTTPGSTLLLAELASEFLPPGVLQRGHAATGTPAGRWSSTRSRSWSRSPDPSAPAWRWPEPPPRDLKRVHLELGGKAPVIVFDDADIEAAAEGIAAAGVLQRRPGLHGGHPGARRCRHPRRVRRGAHRRRPRRTHDRRARRRGRPLRPAQQRRTSWPRSPASSTACPTTP